jgi:hypothetical protein
LVSTTYPSTGEVKESGGYGVSVGVTGAGMGVAVAVGGAGVGVGTVGVRLAVLPQVSVNRLRPSRRLISVCFFFIGT